MTMSMVILTLTALVHEGIAKDVNNMIYVVRLASISEQKDLQKELVFAKLVKKRYSSAGLPPQWSKGHSKHV